MMATTVDTRALVRVGWNVRPSVAPIPQVSRVQIDPITNIIFDFGFSMEKDTVLTTMSPSGTVTVPFKNWQESCQHQTIVSDKKEELRQEAKKFFHTQFTTRKESQLAGQDLSEKLSIKAASNEALVQLIKEFQPCFSEEGTHVNRVWALYCLCGAIEGCTEISNKLLNLLGTFLLGFCVPLEEDDTEDTEEIVRDTAILCLIALVQLPVQEHTLEVAEQRLNLAQTGVEHRCATAEETSTEYDHGYRAGRQLDVRGGLSLLPRARRSLCFDLIRGAIQGMTTMESMDVAEKLAPFTLFAANCLHGESDPRCLMQLLQMLHALQVSFLPFFPDKTAFPKLSLFDAVAPYYPIQFTPPPNDKHGITRLGLQEALMAILSCSDYDAKGERESMLNLSIGIILERLLPMDDDAPSTEDKLETLQDLKSLLSTRCTLLSAESARELSNALIATHAEGSVGVALGKQGPQKALADSCRSLVSKVALDVEGEDILWNVFVKEAIQNDVLILATSPQSMKGRSTIAYLACLAACGGARTLQASLEACLPRLEEALNEKQDEEKVAAAAHGVGAFFSAFEVAFGKGPGIVFHPHPLEPFSANMLSVLGGLFQGSNNESTRIATFRAMVSLLMVTPSNLLFENDDRVVLQFVEALCALVGPDAMDTDQEELKKTVAKSLGNIIGMSMEEDNSGLDSVLRNNESIRASIQDKIFPSLLQSTLGSATTTGIARHDVLAIACACEYSEKISQRAINDITTILLQKIKDNAKGEATGIAQLFAVVLREGGSKVKAAFHQSSVNPIDLIKIIGHKIGGRIQSDRVLKVGTSLLNLPPDDDEKEAERSATSFGYQVIIPLLPAYEEAIPGDRMRSIVDYMNHLVPPLSDWQCVQLSICLPLFSEALANGYVWKEMESDLQEMALPLTEFALDAKNSPRAMSDAVSCLFWIIARHQKGLDSCLSKKLFKDVIFPRMNDRLHALQDFEEGKDCEKTDGLEDILNFVGVMGSAAACRGSSSTTVSNDVAIFLSKLSITGGSQNPFDMGQSVFSSSSAPIQMLLQLTAASAFGAMISMDVGSPFWRQRLTHLAMKEIQEVPEPSNFVDPTFWGYVALQAQIVACGRLSALTISMIGVLTKSLVQGLVNMYPRNGSNDLVHLMEMVDVVALQELVLAGIMKLFSETHAIISKYTGTVVPVMLRLLLSDARMGPKALTLQALYMICSCSNEKPALLALKPAVEAVLLSMLDHPSSIFREMVIETRNCWAILT